MYTEEQIDKVIADCLSGNASPENTAILIAWVQKDPKHLHHYYQLRNIWQVANPAFSPDDIELEEAHLSVMNQIGQQVRQSPVVIYLQYWQRIAAVLLLPLLVLSGYLLTNRSFTEKEVPTQEVFSPYGMRSKVNLPDGTIVWLNAGSQLTYPLVFKEGKRAVHLVGEAFFEVKSDKENPFVVETKEVKVLATGTAFNVEAYTKDSVVAVTMVEGVIDVTIGDTQSFPMNPGERMIYNTNLTRYKVSDTDPYKWYAWKDGILVFRDDPLEHVFKKISQTFNLDIIVKDTSIANQLYRATFEEESLDEILRLLKLTAPIQYKNIKREKVPGNQYARQRIEVHRIK